MKKLRVGIVYGGRSGEHEVSVTSAASIFKHIDRTRYEPVAIRIEKDGRWTLADRPPAALVASEVIEQARLGGARTVRHGRETLMVAYPTDDTLLTVDRGTIDHALPDEGGAVQVNSLGLDAVFPVLHGPYGEDGTIQGLLELANVPYVGSGVLASATGMDKVAAKHIFASQGLPLVPWRHFVRAAWRQSRDAVVADLAPLGFPLFVKPANLGSSVGISKVKTADALDAAVELALEFDRKVVVEAAVPHVREIECAVLGNDDPQASRPGEVIPGREFYDYEAKYLDATSRTVVPAAITAAQEAEVQRLAIAAFRALDAAGLARVDFLLNDATGELFLNEINTMPGFTSISMYAVMWDKSGVPYPALVDRLIQLALARHAEKQQLRTSVL